MNAKTSKIRNTCSTPNCLRPVGGGHNAGYEDADWAKQNGYCLPCANEGQHEIAHTNGHESIPESECWKCDPSKDQSLEAYVPRSGTSRAGMVINVPLKASGAEKAKAVIVKLALTPNATRTVKATQKNGHTTTLIVTLADGEAKMAWDFAGRLIGAEITRDGKTRKARNVAEILRSV